MTQRYELPVPLDEPRRQLDGDCLARFGRSRPDDGGVAPGQPDGWRVGGADDRLDALGRQADDGEGDDHAAARSLRSSPRPRVTSSAVRPEEATLAPVG